MSQNHEMKADKLDRIQLVWMKGHCGQRPYIEKMLCQIVPANFKEIDRISNIVDFCFMSS